MPIHSLPGAVAVSAAAAAAAAVAARATRSQPGCGYGSHERGFVIAKRRDSIVDADGRIIDVGRVVAKLAQGIVMLKQRREREDRPRRDEHGEAWIRVGVRFDVGFRLGVPSGIARVVGIADQVPELGLVAPEELHPTASATTRAALRRITPASIHDGTGLTDRPGWGHRRHDVSLRTYPAGVGSAWPTNASQTEVTDS